MPEAVLAGPNGAPAIDQMTGMPLTMEELLRRRGILGYKGVASPLNMSAVTDAAVPVATPAETALADSASATSANSTGSDAAIGASPNALDENGLPVGATVATPVLNNENKTAQPSDDAPESDWLAWAALAGGAGAAALAAWRMRRNAKAAAPTVDPNAPIKMGPGDPGYSINNTLTRVPSDTKGSNQVLSALVDGKNVAKAGQIGAGPKALAGPQPVEDVSTHNLAESVARNKALPNDYEGPSRGPQTRMEYGSRKQSYMREGTSNDNTIALRDRFTDLDADELKLVTQIAGRLKSARDTGEGKLPARIGTTKPMKRAAAAKRTLGQPIRPPSEQTNQTLLEAVAQVRRWKAQGLNVKQMLPAVRRVAQ